MPAVAADWTACDSLSPAQQPSVAAASHKFSFIIGLVRRRAGLHARHREPGEATRCLGKGNAQKKKITHPVHTTAPIDDS